jgi:hypothetical protein
MRTEMRGRKWTAWKALFVVIPLIVIPLLVTCTQTDDTPVDWKSIPPYRQLTTVSLRWVQTTLERLPESSPVPDLVAGIGGITRLDGYVLDRKHQDVIIFGDADPSKPALNFGDFVVALRNAWREYADREGNTIIYSYPGCSIDPDPETLRDLEHVMDRFRGDRNGSSTEAALEEWHRTCRRPQQVSVFGVPFQSRFAKTMVVADYGMKRIADGSDSLPIPGFRSFMDMVMDTMKSAVVRGDRLAMPIHPFNSFWFYPGEVVCQAAAALADRDILVIDNCPVVLLTAEEHLVGKTVERSESQDPMAKEFAEAFTRAYPTAASLRQPYADLEGLFRMVAVAQMMKKADAPDAAGLDLGYLLNRYAVVVAHVDSTLPGISNVKEFTHRVESETSISEQYLWLPSCGGVLI